MILVKTKAGLQVLKDRSVALSPRQRSAFILFDGRRTLDDVLEAIAAMGVSRADIEQLVALGLLGPPTVRPDASEQPSYPDTLPGALLDLPGSSLDAA